MDHFEHSTFCGPRTFAAIVGCSRPAAAKTLAYWRRRAGWQPDPGTTPMALAVALLTRRYEVEAWSVHPGGWRLESHDEFMRRVWAAIRQERANFDALQRAVLAYRRAETPADPTVARHVAAATAVRRARIEQSIRSPYTVAEFLARRRAGTWALFVPEHVMAARAGRLMTEDQGYDDVPLEQAWRVRRARGG